MLETNWTDETKNAELLDSTGNRCYWRSTVDRTFELIGYTLYYEGLLKLMMEGKIEDGGCRGRPRLQYI